MAVVKNYYVVSVLIKPLIIVYVNSTMHTFCLVGLSLGPIEQLFATCKILLPLLCDSLWLRYLILFPVFRKKIDFVLARG